MTVKITIKCDNAAFDDSPEQEVARILTEAAEFIRDDVLERDYDIALRDINGKNVGSVKVS